MKALFDTVDHLSSSLTYHRDRHTVLAGNVANVDTPGYRPFDLERTSTRDGSDIGLQRSHAAHLSTNGAGIADGTTTTVDSSSGSVGADGNAVNLERELAKIDANRVRYSTTSELVSRRLALLRYSASDGNG